MMAAHHSQKARPTPDLRVLPVLPPIGGRGMDPHHLSSYPIQPGPSTNYLRSQSKSPTQVVIDGTYEGKSKAGDVLLCLYH